MEYFILLAPLQKEIEFNFQLISNKKQKIAKNENTVNVLLKLYFGTIFEKYYWYWY